MSASSMSAALLAKQLKAATKNPIDGCKVGLVGDDIYHWEVYMAGPPDSTHEGGVFRAELEFPKDYPYNPPKMSFTSTMWHPNIHGPPDTGKVCISILHPPVEEFGSGESLAERWNPIQTVETVLISVRSLLGDPNLSSPANIDAGVEYRNDMDAYKARLRELCEKSLRELPEGFQPPEAAPSAPVVREDSVQSVGDWVLEEDSEYDEDEEDMLESD
ncbi:ubiquitin carrier protein [Thecamonas trahens ATCC 50062]|uniref:Ubiquitin carrier protein n=1 Tax=Thecamonas trahens ATCC 50062 TaxID=461836 RepID=A0A0L0D9F6_THETB|nr:ubiquitin carrier protein [Thecamonas trahens ATCC 50062]KNC48974.1 ubiquitin carrier protein [Thecamonas trahens ATCC 50062]|eukprot:XP_013758389.1 ubiquitin carrier protein [Thecamonas trahens ATCC 50062]